MPVNSRPVVLVVMAAVEVGLTTVVVDVPAVVEEPVLSETPPPPPPQADSPTTSVRQAHHNIADRTEVVIGFL